MLFKFNGSMSKNSLGRSWNSFNTPDQWGNSWGKRTRTLSETVLAETDCGRQWRGADDGAGLSGKVGAGAKGRISVYFPYRHGFDGNDREVSLGVWPRDTLAAFRERFEKTRQRSGRAEARGRTEAAGQFICHGGMPLMRCVRKMAGWIVKLR
ncbi:DUF4102 domain-containing protein [Paraburkholderia caballeronis]|uniref:DUF4102 domain-containing protein n=1 Tax=Paraburkholderia caballeronis TaxID=416943 RepID=UPI0010669D7B|nr:DUF4102 domain-containing protein [Paraburkholderia caballeronis]